ncbi:MAG: HEPN domain-containing protein [Bacteroidales bacterium]|nr:HEPN domain-containing protein [Bacteroidales bacterium]
MTGSKNDLIKYRLARAWETLDDAKILAENEKWNSSINRLYYASFYAITALLLNSGLISKSHNGTKNLFSEYFIKTGILPIEYGKLHSQLFTWRQKGDYADLFDFDEEKVTPYIEPVKELIELIENKINKI